MNILEIMIYLGRRGALERYCAISTPKMGSELIISQQSVSRWLINLERDGMIARKEGIRGYMVQITPAGRAYMERMKDELCVIFTHIGKISIVGCVVSGMNEGKYYLGQKEYQERIRTVMGFSPFPGTLNVRLRKPEDYQSKERLAALSGIEVGGFRKAGRTFGSLKCFRCTVQGIEAAAILPERTHYGFQLLEIISPYNLRDKLHLSDGDSVEVEVIPDVHTA